MPSNAASLIIILNKNYALKNINEGISTAIMNLSGLRKLGQELRSKKRWLICDLKYFSEKLTYHTLEFSTLENFYIQKNQNNPNILDIFAGIKH